MKTAILFCPADLGEPLAATFAAAPCHDANGAGFHACQATVYNPDTGAKRETATSTDGLFVVEGEGAGQYILRAESWLCIALSSVSISQGGFERCSANLR